MSTLCTQVVSKLASGLERTVRVASVILSTVVTVLVGRMAALNAEIVGKLAAGFEGSIGVSLEVISRLLEDHYKAEILTPLSLLLAPLVVSW